MNEEEPAPEVASVPDTTAIPADALGELAALKEELASIRALLAEKPVEKPAAPVPATDTPPPAITPKTPDTSALPVYARLAAGYAKNA